jgi:hypothetical protein
VTYFGPQQGPHNPVAPLPALPFGQLRLVQRYLAAEVYAGLEQNGTEVIVVLLSPLGAADQAVRTAFANAVTNSPYAIVPGRTPLCAADLNAERPWAASHRYPGQTGAEWLMEYLPQPSAWGPGQVGPVGPVYVPAAPGPNRTRRRPLGVVFAMAVIAVLLLAAGTAGIMAVRNKGNHSNKNNQATTSTRPSPKSALSGSAVPPAGVTSTVQPTLRSVATRKIAGTETYATHDLVLLADFPGWPVAWQMPAHLKCWVYSQVDTTKFAQIYTCAQIDIDLSDLVSPTASGSPSPKASSAAQQELFGFGLRSCPSPCDANQRNTQSDAFLGNQGGGTIKRADDGYSSYLELPTNSEGKYEFALSTFVSDPVGNSSYKWQICAYGLTLSLDQERIVVHKIINDLYTQVQ